MIKVIEIIITSGILNKYNLMIIPSENVCYLNEQKHSINNEKIKEILSIISLWKNEYGVKQGVDLEEFTITITATNKVDKIHGKGIYPNNYKQLIDIIGELNG